MAFTCLSKAELSMQKQVQRALQKCPQMQPWLLSLQLAEVQQHSVSRMCPKQQPSGTKISNLTPIQQQQQHQLSLRRAREAVQSLAVATMKLR